jgi:hypothetical protein
MRSTIFIILFVIGMAIQFVGGFAVVALFFAGIYTLFVKSVALGLMCIGGAVVGAWIVKILSGLILMIAGMFGERNENNS